MRPLSSSEKHLLTELFARATYELLGDPLVSEKVGEKNEIFQKAWGYYTEYKVVTSSEGFKEFILKRALRESADNLEDAADLEDYRVQRESGRSHSE